FFFQIGKLDPDIVIGYNIFAFDYHYITRRAGIFIKEDFNASRILNKRTEFRDFSFKETEIYFPGRLNIDMFNYVKTLNLPVSSLNFVSETLLNKQKVDLPYLDMFKLIEKGDEESLHRVAHYCIMDSQLTLDIFDISHQWIQLLEVSKTSRIRIDEVYKMGQSIKFTNLLYQYCYNSNICIDDDKEGVDEYHGAVVLEPSPGVYNLCSMLDFTSLYPSVIITHNICYTTLLKSKDIKGMNKDDYHIIDISKNIDDNDSGNNSNSNSNGNVKGNRKKNDNTNHKIYYYTKKHEGILPRMMKILLSERIKFKNLMKTATGIDKIIYDKRQWALKIQANSIYGCLGSKELKFLRFLPGAECTTGMGRNYLFKAIELINETPFEVIYGDTDSCLIKCDAIEGDVELFIKNSIKVAEFVTSNLPEGMHLKYENTFSRLIIISKKKYSGILVNTD
ncbi:DNA/RNA polymerase, partial [Anaeromyces robustus]